MNVNTTSCFAGEHGTDNQQQAISPACRLAMGILSLLAGEYLHAKASQTPRQREIAVRRRPVRVRRQNSSVASPEREGGAE